MNERERLNAALVILAAMIIGNQGKQGKVSDADVDKAIKLADKLGAKVEGKDDDSDDDDSETDDDSDSNDDDGDTEDEDKDSDSDETEDDESDEDEGDDEDSEDDEDEESDKKKSSKKKPAKGKDAAADKKGKKKFKAKPQNYARENDTHREIFSTVLRSVAPSWKKDAKTKKLAKDVSVKLDGENFLDADGKVLASFKQSVKKHMKVK